MTLTPDQLRKVLESHCRDVVNGWDMNTLIEYAYERMMESFNVDMDKDPGVSLVDEDAVKEDIINHHGDLDFANDFLIKCGLDNQTTKAFIGE